MQAAWPNVMNLNPKLKELFYISIACNQYLILGGDYTSMGLTYV